MRLPVPASARGPVGLVVAGLLLAGCSGPAESDGSSGAGRPEGEQSAYTAGLVNVPEAGEPVEGGTVTFGAYTEPTLLDPAETIVAGSTGGVEMAAVYDVLMRWDSERNEVVPQLAESLEASDDHRTWTLRLREGVTFSDGTVLDAEAVRWSLERYVEKGADEAMLWSSNVTGIETPDDRTVVFELAEPWPSFDYMLTTGPGMVVARSSDAGGEFEPVGAGAYELVSHRPQEELVLEARDDYWDGKPPLDRIRFAYIVDPTALYDTFESGGVDLAFTREPVLVDQALEKDTAGFLNMVSLGNVVVINAGEGRPGADPRVRQAMQLALDVELVARRAFDGAGVASSAIFPEFSRWHTDVEPLGYDPDRARELLEEAKADGFDGKVSYLTYNAPSRRAAALTFKSLLEAVGFDVEVDVVRSVADQIGAVAVNRDYDVAGWGISWREAGPYARMFATLHSEGNLTVGMPTTPEMDALIEEFQGAATEEQQRDVMGRIQEQWNEQVPALVYGPVPEFLMWSGDVHGVLESTNSMVLLDDAWVAQEG